MLRNGFLAHTARHAAFSRWLAARQQMSLSHPLDAQSAPFIPPMLPYQGLSALQNPLPDQAFADTINDAAIVDDGDLSPTLFDADPVGDAAVRDEFSSLPYDSDEIAQTPFSFESPTVESRATIPDRGPSPAATTVSSSASNFNNIPAIVPRPATRAPDRLPVVRDADDIPTIVPADRDQATSADQVSDQRRIERHDRPAIALDLPVESSVITETSATRGISAETPIEPGVAPTAMEPRRAASPERPTTESARHVESPGIPTLNAGQQPEPSDPPREPVDTKGSNADVAVVQSRATEPAPDANARQDRHADMQETHAESEPLSGAPATGHPEGADMHGTRAESETREPPQMRTDASRSRQENPRQDKSSARIATPPRTRWQEARRFVQTRLDRSLNRPRPTTDTGATTTVPLQDGPTPPIHRVAVPQAEPADAVSVPLVSITAPGQPSPANARMAADSATVSAIQRQTVTDTPDAGGATARDAPATYNQTAEPIARQGTFEERSALHTPVDPPEQSVPSVSAPRDQTRPPNEAPPASAVGETVAASPDRLLSREESGGHTPHAAESMRSSDLITREVSTERDTLAGEIAASSVRLPEQSDRDATIAANPVVVPPATSAVPSQQHAAPTDTRRITSQEHAGDGMLTDASAAQDPGPVRTALSTSPQQDPPSLPQNTETSHDSAPMAAQRPELTEARDDRSTPQQASPESKPAERSAPVGVTKRIVDTPPERIDDQPDWQSRTAETPPLPPQSDAISSAPPHVPASRAVIAPQTVPTPGPPNQATTPQTASLPIVPSSPVRPRFVAPLPRAARAIAARLRPKSPSAQTEPPIAGEIRDPLSAASPSIHHAEPVHTEPADSATQTTAMQDGEGIQIIPTDRAIEQRDSPPHVASVVPSTPPTDAAPPHVRTTAPSAPDTMQTLMQPEAPLADGHAESVRDATFAPPPTLTDQHPDETRPASRERPVLSPVDAESLSPRDLSDAAEQRSAMVSPPLGMTHTHVNNESIESLQVQPYSETGRDATFVIDSQPHESEANVAPPASRERQPVSPGYALPDQASAEAPARAPTPPAVTPAMPHDSARPVVQSDVDDVHVNTETDGAISQSQAIPPVIATLHDDQSAGAGVTSPLAVTPLSQLPQSEAAPAPQGIGFVGDVQPKPLLPPPIADTVMSTPAAPAEPVRSTEGRTEVTRSLPGEATGIEQRHEGRDKDQQASRPPDAVTDIPSAALSEAVTAASPVAAVGVSPPTARITADRSPDTDAAPEQRAVEAAVQPALDPSDAPPSIVPLVIHAEASLPSEQSPEMPGRTTPLPDDQQVTTRHGVVNDANDQRAEQRDAPIRPTVETPPSALPALLPRYDEAIESVTPERGQDDALIAQSITALTQQIAPGVTAPLNESQPASTAGHTPEEIFASDATQMDAPRPLPPTQADTAAPLDRQSERLPTAQREIFAPVLSIAPETASTLSPQSASSAEPAGPSSAGAETTAASDAAPLPIQRQDSVPIATSAVQPARSIAGEAAPNPPVQPDRAEAARPALSTDSFLAKSEEPNADAPALTVPVSKTTEPTLHEERATRTAIDNADTSLSIMTPANVVQPDTVTPPLIARADGAAMKPDIHGQQDTVTPHPIAPQTVQPPTQDPTTAPVDNAPRAASDAPNAPMQPDAVLSPPHDGRPAQAPAPARALTARDDSLVVPNGSPISLSGDYQIGDAVPSITAIPSADQASADAPDEQAPHAVNEIRQARRRPIIRARPQDEPPPPLSAAEEEAAAQERAKAREQLTRLRRIYYGDAFEEPAAVQAEPEPLPATPAIETTPTSAIPASHALALSSRQGHAAETTATPSVPTADFVSPGQMLAAPTAGQKATETPPTDPRVRPAPAPAAGPTPIALPDATRRFLRPLIGFDPQAVPIYRDAVTDRLTAGYNADALTDGTAVVVASTNVAMGRPETLGLLAHELTHVARRQHPRFVPPIARSEAQATRAPMIAAEHGGTRPASLTEESLAERVEERVIRSARAASAPSPPVAAAPSSPVGMERAHREPPKRVQPSSAFSPDAAWGGLPAPWEAVPDWMRQPPASPPSYAGEASHETAPVGASAPVVQRAANERSLDGQDDGPPHNGVSGEHVGNAEPDLDALARQVYGILKNRLSVERRRIG